VKPVPLASALIPAVDAASFFVVMLAAALAAIAVTLAAPRLFIPVVVVELALGIVIGPHVLGLAQPSAFVRFLSDLGLGMLFFFAGYEIDFARIRGTSLKLGAWGWILSLAIAYGVGGLLAWAGIVLSLVYTGSAMATTAIGTLMPILTDSGEIATPFGTQLLGAGAVGEFGPLLLITLALSSTQPAHSALILAAFVVLAVISALILVRWTPAGWRALERTMESSSQLAVRLAVVLIFSLLALAQQLGLDLLLGGFAAGIMVRVSLRGREVYVYESKLTAVGYGFLIPFFFIVSGMNFNLTALTASPAGPLKMLLFLALFLTVRGVPALLLYRGVLPALRDRAALALYCATQLPLVVAITTIAVGEGQMRDSTAAALVGAAMLSTLIFPLIALRLRGDPVVTASRGDCAAPAGGLT
jgi:Kef-type K+ transport system membrane component KefB